MTSATESSSGPGDRAQASRVVDAPPDAVYRAFLDPEVLSRWYGPADFTVLRSSIDARIGGEHRTQITGPDGVRGWFVSTIRDLIPDRRIVLTWSWVADNPSPSQPPQGDSTVTVELRPIGEESTRVTIIHDRLGGPPDEDPVGIANAWEQALDDLARVV